MNNLILIEWEEAEKTQNINVNKKKYETQFRDIIVSAVVFSHHHYHYHK